MAQFPNKPLPIISFLAKQFKKGCNRITNKNVMNWHWPQSSNSHLILRPSCHLKSKISLGACTMAWTLKQTLKSLFFHIVLMNIMCRKWPPRNKWSDTEHRETAISPWHTCALISGAFSSSSKLKHQRAQHTHNNVCKQLQATCTFKTQHEPWRSRTCHEYVTNVQYLFREYFNRLDLKWLESLQCVTGREWVCVRH